MRLPCGSLPQQHGNDGHRSQSGDYTPKHQGFRMAHRENYGNEKCFIA
jgi:hypothetical protein